MDRRKFVKSTLAAGVAASLPLVSACGKKQQPVAWWKVHDLPWHVHFTHKRHIRAEVDCWACHGQVQAMSRMRQARSLDMGWCVNCHRKENAPTDCWTCHK